MTAPIPAYLQDHYWWAYLRNGPCRFWDQPFMVNLILWGNYNKLCDSVLENVATTQPCRYLQIACAYGNITERLYQHLAPGSTLDLVDIVPLQLVNTKRKLPDSPALHTHLMNAEHLLFDAGTYDHALCFFLLHEQPEQTRHNTLAEALRVLKPGGTLTIIDFSRPRRWHPVWLWLSVLQHIEPFAADLWRNPLERWLPPSAPIASVETQHYFGGLFQRVTIKTKMAGDKHETGSEHA